VQSLPECLGAIEAGINPKLQRRLGGSLLFVNVWGALGVAHGSRQCRNQRRIRRHSLANGRLQDHEAALNADAVSALLDQTFKTALALASAALVLMLSTVE
jgi:hypothetical protein